MITLYNFTGKTGQTTFLLPAVPVSVTITVDGVAETNFTLTNASVVFDEGFAPADGVPVVITATLAVVDNTPSSLTEEQLQTEATSDVEAAALQLAITDAITASQSTLSGSIDAVQASVDAITGTEPTEIIEFYGDTPPTGYTRLENRVSPDFIQETTGLGRTSSVIGSITGHLISNASGASVFHLGGVAPNNTGNGFDEIYGATLAYQNQSLVMNRGGKSVTAATPVATSRGQPSIDSSDRVYIFGGFGGANVDQNSRRNVDGTYSTMLSLVTPARRDMCSVTLSDTAILVYGGTDTVNKTDGVLYNSTSNTKTASVAGTSPPSATCGHGGLQRISATRAVLVNWGDCRTFDTTNGWEVANANDNLPEVIYPANTCQTPNGNIYVWGMSTSKSAVLYKGNPALFGTGTSPWTLVARVAHKYTASQIAHRGDNELILVGGSNGELFGTTILLCTGKTWSINLQAPKYAYKT